MEVRKLVNIYFLLLFYLLFSFCIFYLFFINQPLNIVDEQYYNKLALSILERGEFGWRPGHLTAIRPPLYPVFLALIYKVFGPENYNAVRLIQIFLSLASGWLVYSLAKRIFHEEKVALLATGLFLFYPSLLLFNYLLLTEILFIFLFLLSIWFLLSFKRSFRSLFIAGIFWGLASLTRSVTYPLTPFVALFLIFAAPSEKRGLLAAALFLSATILTLSPWIIRNYRVFGHFVAVDTMGGLNLYMGNYKHTPLHRAWAAVSNPPEIAWYQGHEDELKELNEAEKQRWAIKKALKFMKEHPGLTALRTLIKTANFWQLERTIIAGMQKGIFPGLQNKITQVILTLSILLAYVTVAILGFSGLLLRILNHRGSYAFPQDYIQRGRTERFADWLIFLIISYFTAIHALVFGHSRYHLPLIPLLGIYASYLVVNFRAIRQNQPEFKVILGVVFLTFACFWGYDILIGSKDKVIAFLSSLTGRFY
ncbi:ArnT family glycosyltransferase [Thermosulfuriphilus ammonigenes]|uniref:ArnT family glycosyltransferase n=1 Tax=Thermosulfuriphilus ammonigenes TaxID=1936021 RepID=UPI0015EBB0C3|nr:glycosyltransferase family 39 protein [Thermosulfuriphilus ammonigenes]